MTIRMSDVDAGELEELLEEAEGQVVEDPTREKCSSCGGPSSFMRKDCLGNIHRACTDHSEYLEGWVRDVAHEVHSESAAAARYEEMAYGSRDDY